MVIYAVVLYIVVTVKTLIIKDNIQSLVVPEK